MIKRNTSLAIGLLTSTFLLGASAAAAKNDGYGQGHILIGQPNPHYLCSWMVAPPQNYFPTRGACMSAYLSDS